jgi:hypothetical protein
MHPAALTGFAVCTLLPFGFADGLCPEKTKACPAFSNGRFTHYPSSAPAEVAVASDRFWQIAIGSRKEQKFTREKGR